VDERRKVFAFPGRGRYHVILGIFSFCENGEAKKRPPSKCQLASPLPYGPNINADYVPLAILKKGTK
jgi:hypothetical protein